MKLATQHNGSRDGRLLVVSRDMQHAIAVPNISPTLQYAIENWQHCAPLLNDRYQQLNLANDPNNPLNNPLNNPPNDNIKNMNNIIDFTQCKLMSPLPRCYQWVDGSAYVNHVELVRKARGAEMPDSFWQSPLMYQGGGDSFLGPTENIPLMNVDWGLDLEAEIAIITDDVAEGTSVKNAEQHIKLFMLVNDISLRNLIPEELAKGFGFFQSKPSSSFSPVAVTADELGDAWNGKKLHLPLTSHINNTLFGQPNAGIDMTFDFPTLVNHACKSRRLIAGSIIGSGTVSNYDRSNGSSCIAEKRMLEKIATGSIATPFLTDGDNICIEMFDSNGLSIFGAIKQRVVAQ